MEKILILGAGSLGSEIAYSFSNKYKITCIDHGKNFHIIKKQLPSIKFVKSDINDFKLIRSESADCKMIFYCIDTGGVIACMKYPERYYDVNITNFKELLNSLKMKKTHFFLFSSLFVYPDIVNVTEKTEPNPLTLYGKLRMQQEQILKNQKFGFTILRLSNIFGYGHFVGVGNMGAIEKFIDSVFTGNKLILDGDGQQMVDYVYKEDLMILLEKLTSDLPLKRIYNVSTGLVKPISEIANVIKNVAFEKFGKKVEVIVSDKNFKLPNLPKALPDKAMRDLSWKPLTNFYSQLSLMMDIYNLQHKR